MVGVDRTGTEVEVPTMAQYNALKESFDKHEESCDERNKVWDKRWDDWKNKWDEDLKRLYDKLDEATKLHRAEYDAEIKELKAEIKEQNTVFRNEIKELNRFMWKVMGYGGAAMVVVPSILIIVAKFLVQ